MTPQLRYNIDTVNVFEGLSSSDDSASEEGRVRIAKKKSEQQVVREEQAPKPASPKAKQSPPKPPRQARSVERSKPEDAPDMEADQDAATRASRDGRGQGPRRFRGSSRGGKARPLNSGFETENREFERRSGTGRGRENKKRGGGAYNWGNQGEDFGATEESPAAVGWTAEGTTEEAGPAATTGEGESPLAPAAAAEDAGPKELSYVAYQKQKEAERAELPQPSGMDQEDRKAVEEAALNFAQSGFVAYKKVKEESKRGEETGDEEESEHAHGQKKKIVNLAEVAGSRFFYGRGGRGRQGQKRSPTSDRQPQQPKERQTKDLHLEDVQAFPSL